MLAEYAAPMEFGKSFSDVALLVTAGKLRPLGRPNPNAVMFFSLAEITIPGGVTSIGFATFEDCGISSVTIPAGVTHIGTAAFDICGGLTNVIIPDSVETIANSAFYDCPLAAIIIPGSVTNIGSGAFSHCLGLSHVYFTGNSPIPPNDSSVFQYDSSAIAHYLPDTDGWGSTFDSIPAVPWLPEAQAIGNTFGVQSNEFGFSINWVAGQTVVVESCTNLCNPVWSPVGTNTLAGSSVTFNDPQWTNYPVRFYRLRSP
jgi:hypothetical protein